MSEQYTDLWELTKAQSVFISRAWHGKIDTGDKRPAIIRTPYGEYTRQQFENGFRISAQMVEDGRINAMRVHRLQSAKDLAEKLESFIIGSPPPMHFSSS